MLYVYLGKAAAAAACEQGHSITQGCSSFSHMSGKTLCEQHKASHVGQVDGASGGFCGAQRPSPDSHFHGDGTTEAIKPDRMTLIWVSTAVATLAVVKSEILDTMYTSVGVVTIHCM